MMDRWCTTCGRAGLAPDTVFCTGCGARLDVPAPTPRGGRRVSVVLAVVALLLVVTGVGAWGAGLFRTGGPPPAPVPAPTTSVGPPTTSGPRPTTAPRELVVLGPAAASDSDAATVQNALTDYYTSINDGDYDAWVAAVRPSTSQNQTRDRWLAGYRTTIDDDVEVQSISPGPSSGTVLADLTMRSRQAPQDGPAALQVPCIRWSMTMPVDVATGRVGQAVAGRTSMAAC